MYSDCPRVWKEFRGASFRFVDTGFDSYVFSFYDEDEVRQRWWHVRPGDVVVDVGVDVGSYAIPALALGASHVYAVSPEERTTRVFETNLMINDMESRCTIIPFGLYDKSGYLQMTTQEFSETLRTEDQWIPVKALDDLSLFDLEHMDWFKVDVEGAEVAVLRGSEKLLRAYSPRMLIENHKFKIPTVEREVLNFIDSLDMRYCTETKDYQGVSHTFCWIPEVHGEIDRD